MSHHPENNPHFLPRNNNDPIIEIVQRPSQPRTRPHPPRHHNRTSVEPPYAPQPQPPSKPLPPRQVVLPPHQVVLPPTQESKPHFTSEQDSHQPRQGHHSTQHDHVAPHPTQHGHVNPHSSQHGHVGPHPPQNSHMRHHSHHDHSPFLRAPTSRRTRPIAWLVAALCALFWIIIIIGGLIILIVYLVFRPRNPRFDISTASLNAAYLDMGYLLNAEVTVLANFTNPNTKVNVDFSYAILDLYYNNSLIATRYIHPFTLRKRQTRLANVHLMASQVRLSREQSMGLQNQMNGGRINFEIRGLFKGRSRLGGILHYTYWLNAYCEIAVTGAPSGVMIGKRCATKRKG